MARIRTVKPEFFRHELLQELEREHSGKYPMLVFAGLWGHCDKAGRFEWRPRTLKLDILPFLDFEMVETLEVLEKAGLVRLYDVNGEIYGEIPTFRDHQRINGKEAQEPEKHPAPPMKRGKRKGSNGEATGNKPGSNGEAVETTGREGKGREGNLLPPYSGGFLKFWTTWPRSERKEAKGKCWEIWKKKDFDEVSDQILSHVESLKTSDRWRNGYIPAPKVYLNERRWEGADEDQKVETDL